MPKARGAVVKAEPVGERVTRVETKLDVLAQTVEVKFEELKEMIQSQSLNGRTERAKVMVDKIGSPEDVDTLRSMIRVHDRRAWLGRPLWRATAATVGLVAAAAIGHFWPS